MSEHPKDAEAIFLGALDKATPEERGSYIEGACAGDLELLRRVLELLDCHQKSQGPLDAPPPGLARTVDRPTFVEPSAMVIGPYKLLQQLGEGGMGTVFMAEQTQPVQRKVALKIIKAGMDSRQVIARFEAERQALALMDHPNIAKVFDAGTTDTGRPYFVMELVKGVPITRYCDEQRLTPRQRLALFVPVCQAVQHAHQKGIIHRDIKPSNVLVAVYDDKPVPKVIDFGIAKATGRQLTERTLCTDIGQVVGTLEYMSPEQAGLNQLDIDTRSDIYSLGVLLYELLTGTTPLERKRLKAAALFEMLRLIREEEPPKPSTRLSTTDELPSVAANRGQEPKQLSGLVRGELDWIVMKSLEKDRNRRYETANGFAQDIQRYLADEAVQACPPSAWYRFRKFSRRNKTGLTAAGLVLVALVLGTGISTWQAIRATRAVDAERQTRVALDSAREEKEQQQTRVNRELTESLVEAARLREKARTRPGDAGPWSQLREVLGAAQTLAGHELADPVLGGRVQALLAELKQDDNDRRMVARLEEIRLQSPALGTRGYSGGKCPVYEAAFREYGLPIFELAVEDAARRIQTSAIRDWLVAALDDCADNNGHLIARLLPIVQRGETDPWRKQYFAARFRNDLPELMRLARQPEALAQPPTILCMLASRMISRGESEAIAVLQAAQWRYPADLWINHDLAYYLSMHGDGATPERPIHLRKRAEAVTFCRAALAVRPESRALRQALGSALLYNGDFADAAGFFREMIRLWPDASGAYYGMGQALEGGKDWDGAITAYRKSLGLDATSASTYRALGSALAGKGDLDGAIAAHRKATTLAPQSYVFFFPLARALRARGDLDGAIAAYRKASEGNRWFLYELSRTLWDKGDYGEAIAGYEDIVKGNPKHDGAFNNLAWWLATCPEVKFRNPARAVELARKAVELKSQVPSFWTTLGVAQYRAGDFKAAVAALNKMNGTPGGVGGLFLAMAHHKLGNREQAHKSYDAAIRWLQTYGKADGSRGPFSDQEIRRFRAEAAQVLGLDRKKD